MPWEVKKNGSQYCVYKKGASSPIKGGCHPSRKDAVNHMKALYKNVTSGVLASATTDPYQDDAGLWRIDDVEICSTGIEYKLASGPTTFTADMLADAVKAANDDVAIKPPRIKLGHSSNYNAALVGDAEQAFGRVENLRLSSNGQTIIGDYIGTPEWLAAVLPVAYPSRSIEGAADVETVTGKKYELVITAVSLLGVRWPGCSVLEDLPLWYGSEIPDEVEIDTAEPIAAGGGMDFKSKSEFEAAVDVSLIRRKFYNDGPGAENWSWWIRGERYDTADGYNIIVDMGDGELCRFPVTVDGSDIEFGEYTLVTEEYPDKAMAASAVLAGMAMIAKSDMVVYASRADSPDQPTREENQMDEATRTALAAKLGLPEDATEGQIHAKMAENVLASQPAPGEGEGEGEGEGGGEGAGEGEGEGEGEGGGEGEPQVEAGTVTIDKGTLARLQAGSEAALKHEKERMRTQIAETVNAAVDDGRIPPARREHWTKALAADFAGAKATLDGLEKGLIPVSERGASGGDNEGTGNGNGVTAGLPEDWFPEIPVIRANAAAGRLVTQAKEG
jgi:hypothetical protein